MTTPMLKRVRLRDLFRLLRQRWNWRTLVRTIVWGYAVAMQRYSVSSVERDTWGRVRAVLEGRSESSKKACDCVASDLLAGHVQPPWGRS